MSWRKGRVEGKGRVKSVDKRNTTLVAMGRGLERVLVLVRSSARTSAWTRARIWMLRPWVSKSVCS